MDTTGAGLLCQIGEGRNEVKGSVVGPGEGDRSSTPFFVDIGYGKLCPSGEVVKLPEFRQELVSAPEHLPSQ